MYNEYGVRNFVLHIFCLMWRSDSPPPTPQKAGLSPNPSAREGGVVTTGKRGLSVIEMTEHPLSPPGTGVSTTQWGGGG